MLKRSLITKLKSYQKLGVNKMRKCSNDPFSSYFNTFRVQLKTLCICPTLKYLPHKTDGWTNGWARWTNMTYYLDPYATHMDPE